MASVKKIFKKNKDTTVDSVSINSSKITTDLGINVSSNCTLDPNAIYYEMADGTSSITAVPYDYTANYTNYYNSDGTSQWNTHTYTWSDYSGGSTSGYRQLHIEDIDSLKPQLDQKVSIGDFMNEKYTNENKIGQLELELEHTKIKLAVAEKELFELKDVVKTWIKTYLEKEGKVDEEILHK